MKITAKIVGLMLAWTSSTALAQDFSAPSTISPEAQAALAKLTKAARNVQLPKPGDVEGWKKVQAEFEQKRASANAEVVRKYEPKIEPKRLGGVPVLDIKPKGWKESRRVLVYTHGGAYTLYSAKSRLISAVPMASDTGLRVISIDYTLAPHAKWPEVTSQVVAVIQALVKEGHDLKQIAIYGESAGGGLAAAAVLKMRDQGLGMPTAVVLWSPWSDITDTGDTYATLQDADPLLYYPGNLQHCAAAYA